MVTLSSRSLGVCVFYLLIATVVSFSRLKCRDPLRPVWNSTEAYRRPGHSPFELTLKEDTGNSSRDGGQSYRVEISSKNRLLQFAAVQLAVIKTHTCGHGVLRLNRTDFHQEESPSRDCPSFLFTKSSERLHDLPLLQWKPPSCGCVQFRALVFEDETGFYSDEREVSNGYLTHTVCVRKQEDRKYYTRALCGIKARYSAAEIVSRPSFVIRHGITGPEKRAVAAVLEARQRKLGQCCDKGTPSSVERCIQRMRLHRVDRFCEDGIPEITFTELRKEHMRRQEKRCCFIMGSNRYACFKHKSELPANSTEASILDYSLDETDPLNDLADFATRQDADVVSMLSWLEFGALFESDGDQLEIRDGGSKQEASGERSSKSSKSVDDPDSRQVKLSASSRRLDVRQNPASEDGSYARELPSRKELPPVREAVAVRDQVRELPTLSMIERVAPPTEPASGGLSKARRRMPGGNSSRRGRNRRKNSHRRRNNASRRRSAKAIRNSRPRGKSRGRSGSRERRRKVQAQYSREQSWQPNSSPVTGYPVYNEEEGGSSEAAEIQRRLTRRENRLRVRSMCCRKGSELGGQMTDPDVDVGQQCVLRARQLRDSVSSTEGDRLAHACYKQFTTCCGAAAQSGQKMSSGEIRGNIGTSAAESMLDRVGGARKFLKQVVGDPDVPRRRGGASDVDDESGEALRLGLGRSHRRGIQDLIDSYDRESERRYQNMRSSKRIDEDDEDEDGPARFDKVDNGEDDEDEYDAQDGRDEKLRRRLALPAISRTSDDALQARSRSATEEVDDFDDRDFVDGREDEEEDDDEEEEDDEEDDEEEDEAEDEEEDDEDKRYKQTSTERQLSSRRNRASRRRNSHGEGRTTSRLRDRSNVSRRGRGNRSRRRRFNTRNKNSRRRSRERNSRKSSGKFRQLSRNQSKASKRQEGRNSWKNSGSARDYNEGYRDMRTQWRRGGTRGGKRETPLDSKEQVRANRQKLRQHPFSPVEAYYFS